MILIEYNPNRPWTWQPRIEEGRQQGHDQSKISMKRTGTDLKTQETGEQK